MTINYEREKARIVHLATALTSAGAAGNLLRHAVIKNSHGGLPSNIDIAKASLPAAYEHAKIALASCAKIDECQEWANKAEALATYAKMADDDSLRQLADRIQARAVRRMGELLKQFDAQGRRTDQLSEGALTKLSQAEAAEGAGISRHQLVQAVRVANVPAEKFETAVDAEKPATVTALAEMGKQVRTVQPKPESSALVASPLESALALRDALSDLEPLLQNINDLDELWAAYNGPNARNYVAGLLQELGWRLDAVLGAYKKSTKRGGIYSADSDDDLHTGAPPSSSVISAADRAEARSRGRAVMRGAQ